MDLSVMESVRDICIACNISIMGDHDDGILCLMMESKDKLHDFFGISLIEIPCRFISKQIWYIRYKCSSNRDTLLFAS